MNATTQINPVNRHAHLPMIELRCKKTVQSGKVKYSPTHFTAGEIYIASITTRGNYELETDSGDTKRFKPTSPEFHEIFEEVKQ